MDKKTIITIILLIVGLGIGLAFETETSSVRPVWAHNVQWLGQKPDNVQTIEELLWNEIAPYKTEYDIVNISSTGDANEMRISVTAKAVDSENLDIYEYTYQNNELLLTGYLLEAVPQMFRNEAIGIALSDKDLATSIRNSGEPTVKRILPKTSEKFYAPKTLLSVTWKGISALVDPDERKVVQVWREGGTGK
ncbi:MAG: hypothetical protein O8C61_07400 [Candidatus Methanoperedens sp.]|nr:hypothetical protein [Candidatus Methanoperedens sp.]